VLVSVFAILLLNRTDFSVTILRTAGLLFQEQPNDMISNIYDLNIVNKTFNEISLSLKLENIEGELKLVGNEIVMKPQGNIDSKFLILLPKSELSQMSTPIDIGIYSGDKLMKKVSTSFLAPIKKQQIEENEDED
jgi:hypothetical protein